MRERTRRRQPTPERPEFSRLTLRQRVFLGLGIVGTPLLLLLVLEVGLRVGGYGSSYPLFVSYGDKALDFLVPNPEVARRYFPGPDDPPRPLTDLFRAEKAPGTLRLFVQGESTAAGFPYSYGGAFSRMLEQRLQDGDPTRSVEVINTAITAVNSYTLLDFANEIIAQEPDAVLIYAGHNEYYGAFGVGSSVSLGRMPIVVRGYLWLVRWRSVQLLRSAVSRWRAPSASGEQAASRTLMERMAGERSILHGTTLYDAGMRQFRRNLRQLLDRYHDAGVPVFVATLASNERDLVPFVGAPEDPRSQEDLEARLGEAGRKVAAGDTAGAVSILQEGVRLFPSAADAHYALAQVLDRSGRRDLARTAYLAAKDRDRLPFRAPEAMNDIIRQEAERTGANVVDVQQHLAASSDDGIIGKDLMLEHLHPNITGQFLIADAFYEALLTSGLLGDVPRYVPAGEARPRVPVTAVDSIVGTRFVQRLTDGFPFRPSGPPTAQRFLEPRDAEESIAFGFISGRLNWIEAQDALRDEYRVTGRLRDALHVDLALAQELSFSPGPLVRGGMTALALGDLEQAERLMEEAHARRPTADALRMLAGIRAAAGDTVGARDALEQAGRVDPSDQRVLLALQALSDIRGLEEEVRRHPEDADLIANLGSAYYVTAQVEKARQSAARALGLEPNHVGALRLKKRTDDFFAGVG